MMRGLVVKMVREALPGTIVVGVSLLLAERLLLLILPQIQGQAQDILERLPFVRILMRGLLGVDPGQALPLQLFQAIAWVHPVVLALVWSHEILFCTRVPAGELDRGTIDVLLGLPVSRRRLWVCESMGWLGSGLVVLLLGATGYALGVVSLPESGRAGTGTILAILANLFCLYVAVGGLAYLVSACSDRRGRAIATVFGIVLASFLLSFLAQFWEPARVLAILSVIHYYEPARILSEGRVPVGDMATLLVAGAVLWIAGGEIFARRSLLTA